MSNLLEKASILLTPTAYDDGKILSVKPEDGTGDFDFTRNSSATRVNSQGLIEDMQILSSNLVTNGDFSQEGSQLVTNGDFATDSDWTKQTSWSISGGAANYDFLSDAKYIRQTLLSGGFVAGKAYKINFEITSGTAYMNVNSNGGGLISLNTYSVGSYSIYVTASASGSDLLIYGRNTSGTAFSIDNVSVKEVGQDWSLGTGWSIGADEATHTGSGGYIEQGSLTQGSNYRVVINVTQASGSGFPQIYMGGLTTAMTSVGTYTFNIVAVANDKIKIRGLNDCKISSVSVIEITEDTNLPRINYEGFSYQDSLGSEEIVNGTFDENVNGWVTNNANASFVWQINKTALFTSASFAYVRASPALNLNAAVYKVSFDILSFEGTLSNVHIGLGTTGNVITTTGSYTYFYTSTGGSTEFQIRPNSGGTGSITIDNVSVKEYLGQEVVPDSGCGSWLFEPQSTNRMTTSEPTSGGVGFTFPPKTWANGLINGLNATEATSSIKYWYMSSGIANEYSTFSFFVEMEDGSEPIIGGSTQANSDFVVTVKGRFLAENEITKTNTIGNVWKIEAPSRVNELAGTGPIGILKYSGQSNKTFSATGFQIEQSSFATSYIPTSGSTVTRLQDAAFGAGSSDLINSTEGVLYLEAATLQSSLPSGFNYYSTISDGTTSNRIELRQNGSNIQFLWRVAGVYQSTIVSSGVLVSNYNKIALKYSSSEIAFWINGSKIGSIASPTLYASNTLNELAFDDASGSNNFSGKTKCVAVFKEALTDAELTCLTT